jgi:hypothetical protein
LPLFVKMLYQQLFYFHWQKLSVTNLQDIRYISKVYKQRRRSAAVGSFRSQKRCLIVCSRVKHRLICRSFAA